MNPGVSEDLYAISSILRPDPARRPRQLLLAERPHSPPVEPQPLSPVAQFMVANATGATAVIEDETFGGEVRVTLEDAFLSAAGETCKRATLLSAQHEAEIVVICHNGQEGDGSNPGEWRLMPRVWGKAFPRRSLSAHPSTPFRRAGRGVSCRPLLDAVRPSLWRHPLFSRSNLLFFLYCLLPMTFALPASAADAASASATATATATASAPGCACGSGQPIPLRLEPTSFKGTFPKVRPVRSYRAATA